MRTMSRVSKPAIPILLVGIALLRDTVPAAAATVYVAVNGVDGASCGAKTSPCGSITQAISNAAARDTIIVGPGAYRGESGAPGCSCFVAVNKPGLKLLSSDGAAVTVIDATQFQVNTNVLVIANGAEFGRPGKGFTVTPPDNPAGSGIAIDAKDPKVRGNQVFSGYPVVGQNGITTVESDPGPMLIEGNQVVGWKFGITALGAGKNVVRNVVSLDAVGVDVEGTSTATGNIVSDCRIGIDVGGAGMAIGNAVRGNMVGISVDSSQFFGTITHNDIVGTPGSNNNCGIENGLNIGMTLTATNNYWGAPTGPGPDPADSVCNDSNSTITTPFASAPFTVRARIKP
jgi:hypothetical protein